MLNIHWINGSLERTDLTFNNFRWCTCMPKISVFIFPIKISFRSVIVEGNILIIKGIFSDESKKIGHRVKRGRERGASRVIVKKAPFKEMWQRVKEKEWMTKKKRYIKTWKCYTDQKKQCSKRRGHGGNGTIRRRGRVGENKIMKIRAEV